tara:strand:+ start:324 stop:872 length:549 start_codon:yes stop_codon:yes gene_type:complete
MDLEQESTSITVDTDKTKELSELCNEMLDLQEQVKRIEEQLKKKKDEVSKLSELEIPNLMQQAGVTSLKLADGSSVEVKPFYAARIPQSKESEAFNWLTSNGHGDLIKNVVSLNFQRSQDNEANALVQDLIDKGHNVSQKKNVNPQTLKAFVKDEIQKGNNVPMDLFGVYISNKTTIKTKEK